MMDLLSDMITRAYALQVLFFITTSMNVQILADAAHNTCKIAFVNQDGFLILHPYNVLYTALLFLMLS